MIKMTQSGYLKSIPTTAVTKGLANTAWILMTTLEPQTRFLRVVNKGRECGTGWKGKTELLYRNDHLVCKWSVAFLVNSMSGFDVYFPCHGAICVQRGRINTAMIGTTDNSSEVTADLKNATKRDKTTNISGTKAWKGFLFFFFVLIFSPIASWQTNK